MYCVLGAAVSAAGALLPSMVQWIISIALGVTLLVVALSGSNFRSPVAPLKGVSDFLKKHFSTFLRNKKGSSVFLMGVLNGLLPCGLTFLALTSCITLSSMVGGFVFMAVFGLGTLPVMLGLVSVMPAITNRLNLNIHKVMVVMQVAAGCLLIARVLLMDGGSLPVSTAGVDAITICP